MKKILQWTIYLLVYLVSRVEWGHCNVHQMKLLKYLFEQKGYNSLLRPVSNLNETVSIKLELAMIQLIQLDEKKQMMKSNVWIRKAWNDPQLKWQPNEFGNISLIRVDPSKLWTPDIVLLNNADGNYEVSWQPDVLVDNNGDILWIPPAIFVSSCTIYVEYFPFDEQNCELIFASLTYDATQVIIDWFSEKQYVDLSDYWKSGTWDIVDNVGKIVHENRRGHKPVTKLVYKVTLRRKPLFYTVNLLIPCVLIAFLNVCVFYLPTDSGEKMTLAISILLALIVFLLIISKTLPPTSISIPLVSKYLLFTCIVNLFSIFITTLTINIHFRSSTTHFMPDTVRWLFMELLPGYLWMQRPNYVQKQMEKLQESADEVGSTDDALPKHIRDIPLAIIECSKISSICSANGGKESLKTNADVCSIVDGPHSHAKHGNVPTFSADCGQLKRQTMPSTSMKDTVDFSPEKPSSSFINPTSRAGTRALTLPSSTQKSPKFTSPQLSSPHSNQHSSSAIPVPAANTGDKLFFCGVPITHRIYEAANTVNFIAKNLRGKEDYSRIREDWRYIATVIDRLMLIIFTLVTLAGTLAIILKAPNALTSVNQDEILRKFGAP